MAEQGMVKYQSIMSLSQLAVKFFATLLLPSLLSGRTLAGQTQLECEMLGFLDVGLLVLNQ